LFKIIGIYGSLILFSIQGDSDIPAGKVSFEVDLRYCMYLNQEMQTYMHRINEIEANPPDFMLVLGLSALLEVTLRAHRL